MSNSKTHVNKIIVPFMNDDLGDHVLQYAVDIAKGVNAEIKLVHVLPQPVSESFQVKKDGSFYDADYASTSKALMDQVISEMDASIQKVSYPAIKKIIKKGDILSDLPTILAEEKGDLIVMGTNMIKKKKAGLFTSNTDKILMQTQVPTIVVSDEVSSPSRELVFATDFENMPDRFMEELKDIMEALQLELTILHIGAKGELVYRDDVLKQATPWLRRYNIKVTNIELRCARNVEEGIKGHVRENPCKLLVLGNHQRKGFARVWKSNTVEKLIRDVQIPVMSLNLEA